MKHALLLTTLLIATLLVFNGCGVDETVQADIDNFIKANVQHAQNEDIEAYMKDLSTNNEQRNTTRARAAELFVDYDLSYTLDSIEIKSAKNENAEVEVTISTRKEAGEKEFNNNQVKMLYTLVQEGGNWKIKETLVQSIKRID